MKPTPIDTMQNKLATYLLAPILFFVACLCFFPVSIGCRSGAQVGPRGGGGGSSVPWSDHIDPPPPHIQPVGWEKVSETPPPSSTMIYASNDSSVDAAYFTDENGATWFLWDGTFLDYVPEYWMEGPYFWPLPE